MIRVKNSTGWSTSALRALYRGALKQAGCVANAALEVRALRTGRVTGRAQLGSHRFPGRATMFLPEPNVAQRLGREHDELRDHVAQVMHHEALHAVGANHGDMTEDQRFSNQPVEWAKTLQLVPKKKPTKIAEQGDVIDKKL